MKNPDYTKVMGKSPCGYLVYMELLLAHGGVSQFNEHAVQLMQRYFKEVCALAPPDEMREARRELAGLIKQAVPERAERLIANWQAHLEGTGTRFVVLGVSLEHADAVMNMLNEERERRGGHHLTQKQVDTLVADWHKAHGLERWA